MEDIMFQTLKDKVLDLEPMALGIIAGVIALVGYAILSAI
jgi:hypothetical protein